MHAAIPVRLRDCPIDGASGDESFLLDCLFRDFVLGVEGPLSILQLIEGVYVCVGGV